MERNLLILKKQIKADFWLSPEGDVIYSNVCTLYPKDLQLIVDLDLIIDTYMVKPKDKCLDFRNTPCLRFFKNS